jgi:hypothetical protein
VAARGAPLRSARGLRYAPRALDLLHHHPGRDHGTLGRLVDRDKAKHVEGHAVARGAITTIDLAAEVKILNKAMIKQIDRVVNDLDKQVRGWKQHAPDLVSLAIVGINHAPVTTSYEGGRSFRTDGRAHKHPASEAAAAEKHIKQRVVATRLYDEVLLLRYSATNEPPYAFAWVDGAATEIAYRAALIRLSGSIERRL